MDPLEAMQSTLNALARKFDIARRGDTERLLEHACLCLRRRVIKNELVILCDIIHHIQNEGYEFMVCSTTNAVASMVTV